MFADFKVTGSHVCFQVLAFPPCIDSQTRSLPERAMERLAPLLAGRTLSLNSLTLNGTIGCRLAADKRKIKASSLHHSVSAITHRPEERLRRLESAESSKPYPGAIIAANSPAFRTRRTGPMKADCNSRPNRRSKVAERISSRSFPGRRESRLADSCAGRSVCRYHPPACSRRRKPPEPGSGRDLSCRPDTRRHS